jgi:lysyl-tRNA synthetase class 2
MPVDNRLLAALAHGLPDSSGVALGFDRLVMLAAGTADLDGAMPFSLHRN